MKKFDSCSGQSVGAIIKKDDNILMLDRLTVPLGWACPAGHIEAGEKPEQALIREIQEETNLKIKKYQLRIHEFLPFNNCSRGVNGHDLYLYEILDWQGEVKLMEKTKHRAIDWKSPKEIKELQAQNKLEPVWQYFFNKLKII